MSGYLKLGSKAPKSGHYEFVGLRGGSRNREVTSVKSDRLHLNLSKFEKKEGYPPFTHY